MDEASSSISQATAASESIDKATFILSVATPPEARDSIEEFQQNSSMDLSQTSTLSETQSYSEVKHFPSPVHNQPLACTQSIPDVVPPPARLGLPMRLQKLTVNVGAQVSWLLLLWEVPRSFVKTVPIFCRALVGTISSTCVKFGCITLNSSESFRLSFCSRVCSTHFFYFIYLK